MYIYAHTFIYLYKLAFNHRKRQETLAGILWFTLQMTSGQMNVIIPFCLTF